MSPKHIVAALALALATSTSTNNCLDAQTLYGSAGSLQARENAHNADWAYNWGIEPNNNAFSVDVANYEFVPMIWSATAGGVGGQIDRVLALENNFGVHVDYVLGFNEPELSSQANMTVQQAIDAWEVMTERFSSTDIQLVSPAVSGGGAIRDNDPNRPDGWLTEFMDEVESRNADNNPANDLQVDVIAYHFYTVGFNGANEANTLINQIDDLYQRYGRPIWITEFAGTSFSADNAIHSQEERQAFNRAFLEALIPQFDARPYVERVSWWQFGAGVSGGGGYSRLSTVSGGVYTPSIVGEVYMRTTLDPGQTYDFAARDHRPTYVHYLKGSNLANNGPDLPEALNAVDVMEGTTTMSGSGDFGFENDADAYVRIRAGATLQKQGNNTVSVPDAPIFNDGTMSVTAGTLLLEDGARLTGSGNMTVSGFGTLATSSQSSDDSVELELPQISLSSATLDVQNGLTRFSEDLNISGFSEIVTDGNLVLSGTTSGSGIFESSGEGTLFLTGTGSHSNGAFVTEGKMIVANTQASAVGPGSVSVSGTGTLGGIGQIGGALTATAGTVSPGIAETITGETTVPDFDEGVVVDAIDFDFTGVQDDAPLTQTSTLAGGLRLVSGLDFGSGVRPRNAANDGNEFNVAGFRTDTNSGAASNQGDYLTFTIAPVDGLAMVIEDISFQLRRNGTAAATQYMIVTSIDGFAFTDRWGFLTLDSNNTTTQTFTATNPGSEPISDEVEVRITGVGSGNDAGNTHFYAASVDASFVSSPNGVALDPTGTLALGGDYTQLANATLKIDLQGPGSGEFDQLQVAGDVSLNGTLDVSTIEDFTPIAGQSFDIITADSVTGTFSNVVAPGGMDLDVIYSNATVSVQVSAGLIGDVNLDGVVNFLDINPFIERLSTVTYQFEADANQDNVINFLDISAFIAILATQQ